MAKPANEDTGSAARLLVGQMQRERRSFWGILAVFFLLLAGIGGMLAYQIFALRSFTAESRLKEFTQMGLQSRAMEKLRSGHNDAAVKLRESADRATEAQLATGKVWDALKSRPEALVAEGLSYARQHFLGRPLNQSTAMVVTGALKAATLAPGQKALLDAAILDWSIPSSMVIDTVPPQQFPDIRKVRDNAAILLADPDPAMQFFGHMAEAAYLFRKVSNGGLQTPSKPYMDWDNGCEQLVDLATKALKLGVPVTEGSDPGAIGLNLRYWRGQCWRRHGEPDLAFEEFSAMMKVAESDALPPTNPLKYQAYHGMGTVMTTLLHMGAKTPEQVKADAKKAGDYLKSAGDFRVAAGYTEFGRVSSTGNIGFLLLQDGTPEGLVKALRHTQGVNETLASTWNLVAQLVIVRAMQGGDSAAQKVFSDNKFDEDKLNEIVAATFAALAYMEESSLPKTEFRNLLDEKHYPALDQAISCVGKRQACFELAYPK